MWHSLVGGELLPHIEMVYGDMFAWFDRQLLQQQRGREEEEEEEEGEGEEEEEREVEGMARRRSTRRSIKISG
jgi:hypothetical protein